MMSRSFLSRVSAFATALFVLPFFGIWRRQRNLEAEKYLDEQLARQRAEGDLPQRYL